ncbi:hypothetical protein CSW58_08810 [Caulobacter sp. B11]|uniref:class I SAM-dependent methyltransferase n=1 Tax=Caulobacter sp. B11 TaxID=2048899 RepID=UPI000C12B641|nr:class I SAM-dependent methyltransferase [Caulobacter sp. B11]PHY12990.1 hypothetical protein CSW58_08810 [Caulobacter sp. B11]
MSKVDYLLRSVVRHRDADRQRCPNCGAKNSILIERKLVVTELRRCDACMMMFRTPTDAPAEAADFYNHEYAQGFTTDMPEAPALAELKARGFTGTEKDYSYYIDVLRQLGAPPGAKLFDFGCSWGYGSYQFARAGFDTLSYEISAPRRRFGVENLGVQAVSDFEAWANSPEAEATMDVFFSAHVLEHVPSPSLIIALAQRVLKPGGLFVAFVPNGSAAFRSVSPTWSRLWGEVHPNFLDEVFFNAALSRSPRLFGASPVTIDEAARGFLTSGDPSHRQLDDLKTAEMLCAARLN